MRRSSDWRPPRDPESRRTMTGGDMLFDTRQEALCYDVRAFVINARGCLDLLQSGTPCDAKKVLTLALQNAERASTLVEELFLTIRALEDAKARPQEGCNVRPFRN